MSDSEDEEPTCDITGLCEAELDAKGISNCIHCGKELIQRDGQWWTWDADMFPDRLPQKGP